ncbi:hypothetical protein BV20DRAFT_1020196 [Pilatotrama ljubarskyi]|nr:hypothetical protein BV20DRAFT_1020196 [Pilatotrama ljubarskyi]
MTKKRPARRLFGRPPDGPGPQDTFNGSFQITPPPTQTHQGQFRLSSSAQRDLPLPVAESSREPRDSRARDRQRRRAGSSSEQSTVSAPAASPSAREEFLSTHNPAAAAGPSAARRRPSDATHRATQSSPAVVTTAQAAGANFRRTRSTTALEADLLAALNTGTTRPGSLPADEQIYGPPLSGYRGTRQPAPGTPEQSSPFGMAPTLRTSSSESVASLRFHRRLPSRELPGALALDTLSYGRTALSPAPQTPSDSRGPSVPPSVFSESSPYLGLMMGEFSPELRSTDGDGEELPPLTPDHAAADLPRREGRARSHSSATHTAGSHGLFMSAGASQSSISVPEELRDLTFPPGLFDSEAPISPSFPKLPLLPGLPDLDSPAKASLPSRSLSRPPPGR